jgi:hypothetical protein
MLSLMSRKTQLAPTQRRAFGLALGGLGAGMVFLAVMSVAFDFHDCFYPSRVYPYLNSGRLLTGALIPFLVVYIQGLDWALRRWQSERLRWTILALISVFLAVSEIVIYWPVFGSQYNWFHMLGT